MTVKCLCTVYVSRDAEIKEEVKKSRGDRSPQSGHQCHRNGKVDPQENSQRIPVIRYGELIVLGYEQLTIDSRLNLLQVF